MSANAKKISQLELRKFMNAHKRKALDSLKKIESPLAKYPFVVKFSYLVSCVMCSCILCRNTVIIVN